LHDVFATHACTCIRTHINTHECTHT
jgi:hypothetical protein